MKAFWWVVREIYSLRETLTKNFEVNSTNVTESNERTNTRTNERTNERTDKRQGENYIPRGINAGGIKKIPIYCLIDRKNLFFSVVWWQSLGLISWLSGHFCYYLHHNWIALTAWLEHLAKTELNQNLIIAYHPWLSMYIQGLILNETESFIPKDCHCGETNRTSHHPNILVSTRKCVIDADR